MVTLGIGRAQAQNAGFVTVEQTLKLATSQYIEGPPQSEIDQMKRGNPAARPELYKIMKDPAQKKIWHRVIYMFGYIGNAQDIQPLVDFIWQYKGAGLLKPDESAAVRSVLGALSGMNARGIAEAGKQLDAMADPAYWKDAGFETAYHRDKAYPTFENEMVLHALRALAFSGDPLIAEKIKETLTRIQDPAQHKVMEEWTAGIPKEPGRWGTAAP
jgi:hypothetical protein